MAPGSRRQITSRVKVGGRTTRVCKELSCLCWSEGQLGGDNGAPQSRAGAGCERAEAAQLKAGTAIPGHHWGRLFQGLGSPRTMCGGSVLDRLAA